MFFRKLRNRYLIRNCGETSEVLDNGGEDGVNLRELLFALVHNWAGITLSCFLGAFASAYYAFFIAEEKFESFSTFSFIENKQNINYGNLGNIAAIAGLSLPSGSSFSAKVEPRVLSNEFILELDKAVDFYSDKHINPPLNNRSDDISRKSFLSKVIIWLTGSKNNATDNDNEQTRKSIIRQNISTVVKESLDVSEKNGVFSIKFVHSDPERASKIVNAAVALLLRKIEQEQLTRAREQLSYLEGELARIQDDLETAAQDFQAYAVENNLGSDKDLARSSVRNETLRSDLKALKDSKAALILLEKQGDFDKNFLSGLRDKYPLIASLDFRSRLNLPVDLGQWERVDQISIDNARKRIDLQIEDLSATILDLENKARQTAKQAGEYAKLKRAVLVQETLYEVIVKQFEAQSLSYGIPGKVAQIYEVAVPAVHKSEPKRILIIALGLILGLFVGAAIVLFRSSNLGMIYTIDTLKSRTKDIGLHIFFKSFGGRNLVSLDRGIELAAKNSHAARSLLPALGSDKKLIGVTCASKLKHSRAITTLIANYKKNTDDNLQIFDLRSSWSSKGSKTTILDSIGEVKLRNLDIGVEYIQTPKDLDPHMLCRYLLANRRKDTTTLVFFGDVYIAQSELMINSGYFDEIFVSIKPKVTCNKHIDIVKQIYLSCKTNFTFVCPS